MARRRIPVPSAEALLALVDAEGRLAIRATPNASADALLLPSDAGSSELLVRTTATPEGGKVNEAILRLLADALGQPISTLEVLRGGTGRSKVVRVGTARR